jgi:uncharacterized protein (TIGR02246 family)
MITEAEVKELWFKWSNAVHTYDPEKVAQLYHPDSVLIPTLSNKIRTDYNGKYEYFTGFLAKKPIVTINEEYVNIISSNMVSYNGIYTFDFTAIEKKVYVRFTYVYTLENAEWKIKTQHSSAMPIQVS